MQILLSIHKAKYDKLFKIILGLPFVLIVCSAISTSGNEPVATWGLMGIVVFVALLFWIIMPRKFLIMRDRVKFVLGANLSFSIHFAKIKTVRELKGTCFGINFSTSFKESVEIVRSRGLNINFSPEDRSGFLYNLETALENWRRFNR